MLLEVKNLRIAFRRGGHETVPVRDVSFSVPEHGRVALVGESGCGKSLTALSLAHLPPTDSAYISGTETFTEMRLISYPASVNRRMAWQVLWRMISVSMWI